MKLTKRQRDILLALKAERPTSIDELARFCRTSHYQISWAIGTLIGRGFVRPAEKGARWRLTAAGEDEVRKMRAAQAFRPEPRGRGTGLEGLTAL